MLEEYCNFYPLAATFYSITTSEARCLEQLTEDQTKEKRTSNPKCRQKKYPRCPKRPLLPIRALPDKIVKILIRALSLIKALRGKTENVSVTNVK